MPAADPPSLADAVVRFAAYVERRHPELNDGFLRDDPVHAAVLYAPADPREPQERRKPRVDLDAFEKNARKAHADGEYFLTHSVSLMLALIADLRDLEAGAAGAEGPENPCVGQHVWMTTLPSLKQPGTSRKCMSCGADGLAAPTAPEPAEGTR